MPGIAQQSNECGMSELRASSGADEYYIDNVDLFLQKLWDSRDETIHFLYLEEYVAMMAHGR